MGNEFLTSGGTCHVKIPRNTGTALLFAGQYLAALYPNQHALSW